MRDAIAYLGFLLPALTVMIFYLSERYLPIMLFNIRLSKRGVLRLLAYMLTGLGLILYLLYYFT